MVGRWLRVAGTGAGFLSFLLGAVVLSLFALPVLSWRGRGKTELERIHASQAAARSGFHVFLKALCVYGVCTWERPEPPERPAEAFVLVSNHPSLLDVVAILATVPNVCCVVRRGLFDLPFLSPLLRRCGHITGPARGEDEGDTPILDRIVERLEQGLPVLVFPEGSRSPQWGLRRFKRGAVEAAQRARVPILPAFVLCDPSALRKDQPWHDVPDRPFNLTVEFLPVMNPGLDADSRSLTTELAAWYRERVDAARLASVAGGEGR